MFTIILLTVLQSFLAKVDTTLFETDYSITITDAGQIPMSINGHLLMQGQLFRATIFDDEVAYDGRTLYLYKSADNELNLSEPTPEELTESNPLLYAQHLLRDNASAIQVTRTQSNIPEILVMHEGTREYKLVLSNPTFPTKPSTINHKPSTTNPTSPFTLFKPGAYINDLR